MSYKHNVGYKQNAGYKNLEFDRDSIFLVTGGAGFIGSNLCEALLDMGYQVRCMDNFSTGKRENIDGFLHNKNFTLIEDDGQLIHKGDINVPLRVLDNLGRLGYLN